MRKARQEEWGGLPRPMTCWPYLPGRFERHAPAAHHAETKALVGERFLLRGQNRIKILESRGAFFHLLLALFHDLVAQLEAFRCRRLGAACTVVRHACMASACCFAWSANAFHADS